MITKDIVFFGQRATHACDGRCDKAWGSNGRPHVQLSNDIDDFAYLADDELGEAPEAPGTYEGFDTKPIGAKGPDDINKWCVRECERAWLSKPGQPDEPPELPDYSVRHYNKPPHRREPSGDLAKAEPPVEQLVRSLKPEQARRLVRSLEPTQARKLRLTQLGPVKVADRLAQIRALVTPANAVTKKDET
jgi:hypothetical protein